MDFLRYKWNTYHFVSFICSLLCVFGHQSLANVSDRTFFKQPTAHYGFVPLSQAWSRMSRSGCLARCMSRYSGLCQSFVYNARTGLCTPGSNLTSGNGLGIDGDLFAPSACDTKDGFKYVTFGDESACMMTSDFQTDFYTARDYYINLGAHLFVGRRLEKFALIPKDIYFFIGLTDLDVEGKFAWLDNGEEITSEFKTEFFRPSEPNNSNNEDCVQVYYHASTGSVRQGGNDAHCTSPNRFVCELPIV